MWLAFSHIPDWVWVWWTLAFNECSVHATHNCCIRARVPITNVPVHVFPILAILLCTYSPSLLYLCTCFSSQPYTCARVLHHNHTPASSYSTGRTTGGLGHTAGRWRGSLTNIHLHNIWIYNLSPRVPLNSSLDLNISWCYLRRCSISEHTGWPRQVSRQYCEKYYWRYCFLLFLLLKLFISGSSLNLATGGLNCIQQISTSNTIFGNLRCVRGR